jgi:hypothetical protein
MPLLQKAYLGSTALFKDLSWYDVLTPASIVSSGNSSAVTANTSAHTKGSWTQLIASTAANSSMLCVVASNITTPGTNTATLVDIATGSAGNEVVILENIAVGGATSTNISFYGITINVPFQIPSGTRISARIQSVVTGGRTANIAATVLDLGDYSTVPTSVDCIGGDTANSQGISMSGASGTWVQATASTSRAYRAVALIPSMHSNDIVNTTITYGVGIGASGSEVQFAETQIRYGSNESTASVQPYIYTFGKAIPSGSRIAVKHNIAANPDRYGVTLIGIP